MDCMYSNIIYLIVGSIGFFVVISSYFISKKINSNVSDNIYWFFILMALYPFALFFLLLHPNFKNWSLKIDRTKIKLSLLIYFFLIAAILVPIFIGGNINGTTYNNNELTMDRFVGAISNFLKFMPDWLILPLFILTPVYCIFVAYWIATTMKEVDNERPWFYSTLFFHLIILCYILASVHPGL